MAAKSVLSIQIVPYTPILCICEPIATTLRVVVLTTCYQYTAVGKYCTSCVQIVWLLDKLPNATMHIEISFVYFQTVKWTVHQIVHQAFNRAQQWNIFGLDWCYLNKNHISKQNLGFQKACWSQPVEMENNFLLDRTWVERHNLIGCFFWQKKHHWLTVRVPGFITRHSYSVRVPSYVTYQSHLTCTNDNLYVYAIICICMYCCCHFYYSAAHSI